MADSAPVFEARFQVAWADIDFNRHMGNASYFDYVAQTRWLFWASQGLAPDDFVEMGIGPAALTDTVSYRRELNFMEEFTVNFMIAGYKEDRSRGLIVNQIHRLDGDMCAEVKTLFAWIDLAKRKITPPPPKLAAAMGNIPRTADWAPL